MIAKQFRKKSIVIEAIEFDGTMPAVDAICAWARQYWVGKQIPAFSTMLVLDYENTVLALEVPTIEGRVKAQRGDYIIKGIQGEIYPCKRDIFEQTYEAV